MILTRDTCLAVEFSNDLAIFRLDAYPPILSLRCVTALKREIINIYVNSLFSLYDCVCKYVWGHQFILRNIVSCLTLGEAMFCK